jgi:transcriptional regulator with XRE-family HTH domain
MGEFNDVKLAFKREQEVEQIILRIRSKMRPWGITITFLAMQLGVSRQYVWQIVYYRTMISRQKALEVERTIDETIAQRRHLKSFGDKLRAARISAGLTLRQAAEMIGYTWIAIERWEQNKCLPKPGVLFHLKSVYGVGEDWLPVSAPTQLKQAS